jgi:hypothetical protein
VHRRLLAPHRLPGLGDLGFSWGCSTFILVLTAAYLAAGLLAAAAWQITREDAWIKEFFNLPGAALLVTLAGLELALSLRVAAEFSPGQLMRTAWRLIALSALCDLTGALASQVFGTESPFNVLRVFFPSPSVTSMIHEFGLLVGGPLRFSFLAAGLFWSLRVYRRAGFLGRLAAVDWAALALALAYIMEEARGLIRALEAGRQPAPAEIMQWPVDPLLWVLLLEALLLFRSVRETGIGSISRCWMAFSIGIVLITLGDIAIWATNYGYLPWPWSSLGWYVWMPAAGALAVAPAYQLEAIHQARRARERTPWAAEQGRS